MKEEISKFVDWTKKKIRIHLKTDEVYFYEREIWWASLGMNIGFEQDGKNDEFERPILILRKFGKDTLWSLPLTSKDKTGEYYYQFEYDGEKYSAILSQLRLVSSKRLLRKIRTISEKEYAEIKEKIRSFL